MSKSECKYPEHEKLNSDTQGNISTVLEFMEWVASKDLELGQWEGHSLNPVRFDMESFVAEHFGVDMKIIEAERKAMLSAAGI